jgi:dihydroorotate dehydrogenase electron transfer subunit
LSDAVRNLLLVSDTQTISPLLGQMRRALDAGISVTLALGGSQASTLYPVSALPPVVEFQAATLDGSLGHRGPVTDLLPELLGWTDAVCALGSTTLYRTLKAQAEKVRLRAEANFLYGIVANSRLACGVGACLSCVVETEASLKLTCVDGPVFDLTKLSL